MTDYQTSALSAPITERFFTNGTPSALGAEFWEFLNTAIKTANLNDVDEENIMDMVDLSVANMIFSIPEEDWEKYEISTKTWMKKETGEMVLVKDECYPITRFWDSIRAMTYVNICNSRSGHLIKAMTETRNLSESKNLSTISELRPMPGQVTTQEKKGWRAL